MKKLSTYILLIMVLISCSKDRNQMEKVSIDSLKLENQKKDSIIELMVTQLNDLRAMRYSDKKSKNTLYGKITPEIINDYEFSTLINTFDTTISHWNGEYFIRILKSCNGSGDLDLPYCNCSDNIYISTGNEDIPEEHYLFKVGPYMEAKIDSFDKVNSTLCFTHNLKGKDKAEKIKVSLTNVKIEK